MLEKRIIQKLLEKMDTVDPAVARLMVERTGIVFTFAGGVTGKYVKGMMRPTGSESLVDFDPEAITGFVVASSGLVNEFLEVDQTSQLQDLQNQVAELNIALAQNTQLLEAADATIAEMSGQLGAAANVKAEEASGEGEGGENK